MSKKIMNNDCPTKEAFGNFMLPLRDVLNVVGSKWAIPAIASLYYSPKRFSEISKDLEGVTDRVLSAELKNLEANKLISRKIIDGFPPRVEYSITTHGKTLGDLIGLMMEWGKLHRKKVIGN